MDVRAYGKGFEEFYDSVRESGVLYRRGNPSEIIRKGEKLLVRAEDTFRGEEIDVEADLVVLAVGMVARKDTSAIAGLLKLSRSADGIPVTPFDRTLCSASRGACIPQPEGAPALESLSDRLLHRLQIRDFGSYRTMLAAHTVDVNGTGIAGIRWYEFRQPTGGSWSLYQEGTYAPAGGQYRWMPRIAMNGRGDTGLGFLLGGPLTYLSVAATGQSAAASGSGAFDAVELACVDGGGVQEGVARSGDYSSTSIDPADDTTFWHTNEYVKFGGNFIWDTYVCPFTIGGGGGGNAPPSAVIATPGCSGLRCAFDGSGSSDSDGTIAAYAWPLGDGGTATGATANHTYAADGTYTVSLTSLLFLKCVWERNSPISKKCNGLMKFPIRHEITSTLTLCQLRFLTFSYDAGI